MATAQSLKPCRHMSVNSVNVHTLNLDAGGTARTAADHIGCFTLDSVKDRNLRLTKTRQLTIEKPSRRCFSSLQLPSFVWCYHVTWKHFCVCGEKEKSTEPSKFNCHEKKAQTLLIKWAMLNIIKKRGTEGLIQHIQVKV